MDIENSDPRRGFGHEKVLTRIRLDDAALELIAKQGFTLDSVPDAGTRVQLALTGNMSTGGTAIDRTMETHPENVEIAETAAQVVGLDIAGIDMVVPDIGVPIREQGGAIVEVNAAPGFRMHTHPTEGEPQYVAKPVIDLLFPAGTDARIPIIGVTGTNGKTTTVRMIAHILKLMGRRVGMTTTDGIVIDGRLTRKGDMSGPRSARRCSRTRSWTPRCSRSRVAALLREGLGYDRNDVAVVTNVTGDHLGLAWHRHGRASWPPSRASWWTRCPATARRCSMRTTRSWRGWPASCRRPGHLLLDGRPRRARRASTGSTGTAAGAARRWSSRRPTTASCWPSARAAGRCPSSTRTSSRPRSTGAHA